MNKQAGLIVKTALFLSVIYIWPSCHKKDNVPPPSAPSNNDTTKTVDTTQNPKDTTTYKGWMVTTLAGSGTLGYLDGAPTVAKLGTPASITIDANDYLYLSEPNNHCIRKVAPTGVVSTFVKEDSSAGYVFGKIDEIVTDKQGNFFLPGFLNHSYYIRKLTATQSTVFAGNEVQGFKDGFGTDARFYIPMSIAVDPASKNMYVPDIDGQGKFAMRKITPAGQVSTLTLTDNTGISNGTKDSYHAITADSSGNIYFAANLTTIKKIDPQGNVTVLAGSNTAGFKDGKGQQAQFKAVISLQVDKARNVWVCDATNNVVRMILPDGTVTTIAGDGTAGYKNGSAATAQFKTPYELAIGSDDAIYIIDNGNNVIRKLKYY